MSRLLLVLMTLVIAMPVTAQEENEDDDVEHGPPVLFDSHEVIEFTLEADFDQLKGDRSQESEDRPAVIKWTEPDGTAHQAELQVRTRGIFRLERSTCGEMPPIRLNFKVGQMEGTVFQGQDKVKMITFCRDRDSYEQDVIEEYLTYRIYNELTDVSFGARLAHITYVDTSGDDDPITRYGFMIEAEDALAERLGGRMIYVPSIPPGSVDGPSALRLALFQYLIGNTDYSALEFHNVRLVRTADGRYLTVPYDFDMAGFINTSYAVPDPSLRLRNVRERLYRGYCQAGGDYQAAYDEFTSKRDAIYALINTQEGLEDSKKRDVVEYVDEFFNVIEGGRNAERQIEDACRRVPGR